MMLSAKAWYLFYCCMLFCIGSSSGQVLFAQTAKVRPHNYLAQQNENLPRDFVRFRYPIVEYPDQELQKRINAQIKYMVFYEEHQDPKVPLDSLLQNAADDAYITSIDYLIGHCDDQLLSLLVYGEFYAMGYTRWTRAFTFDLSDGSMLGLAELVKDDASLAEIKDLIKEQKTACLKSAMDDLQNLPERDKSVSPKDLDNMIFNLQQCQKRLNVNDYFLWPDYLQIIDPCPFSRLMQVHEPQCDLLLSLDKYDPLLRLK